MLYLYSIYDDERSESVMLVREKKSRQEKKSRKGNKNRERKKH